MAHAYTKELIRQAFVDCLDEKPLAKISVTEIASRCEINRNTFYYYYPDIYAVLSEVFHNELEKALGKYNATRSWEEGFIQATSFALLHRKCIYHVYHSMQREELERYLYDIAGDVMLRYVVSQNEAIGASEETCKTIALFYQCALTEMVLQWVSSDLKEDPEKLIRWIGRLFDGNIEASLKKGRSMNL